MRIRIANLLHSLAFVIDSRPTCSFSLPRRIDSEYADLDLGVNWTVHLKDDPALRERYIDRDLGRWDS